ncbi:MAG: radical SAM protein [Clostridia bacterium]|nr:radical SAM protein [Clostridia bacterium]
MLEQCMLCPHNCKVNRLNGQIGRCKCNDKIKIALVSLHKYEEPCISGKNGSGTVFFSNCNLNCMFCQNYEISHLGKGYEVSVDELANIFIEQQNRGAHNINLVTPTMYVIQIIEAIKKARENGLKLPIIYNTSSYENVETIQMLKGYIDVYLPDLKYYSNDLCKKYSKVDNYFENASKVITEMYKQVGTPEFDEDGMIKKGVIIRHLILPNYIQNTKHILKWIKENMPDDVYVSVMSQYFPSYKAVNDDKINRKLNKKEYKAIEEYIYMLDLKNGYLQDFIENEKEEQYVPDF